MAQRENVSNIQHRTTYDSAVEQARRPERHHLYSGAFPGQVGLPDAKRYPAYALDDESRDNGSVTPWVFRSAFLQGEVEAKDSHKE